MAHNLRCSQFPGSHGLLRRGRGTNKRVSNDIGNGVLVRPCLGPSSKVWPSAGTEWKNRHQRTIEIFNFSPSPRQARAATHGQRKVLTRGAGADRSSGGGAMALTGGAEQVLTPEQSATVTEAVIRSVRLPLPAALLRPIVLQLVTTVSANVATRLPPKLKRSLRNSKGNLSSEQLDELTDVLLQGREFRAVSPLLSGASLRPVVRAIVETLMGKNTPLRLARVGWGDLFVSSVGIENDKVQQAIAVDIATAINIPGLSEEQEVKLATWVVANASKSLLGALPPSLIPVLRVSTTAELAALRPQLTAALVDSVSLPLPPVPGLDKSFGRDAKLAVFSRLVDYLFEQYVTGSGAEQRLMTVKEREQAKLEQVARDREKAAQRIATLKLNITLAKQEVQDVRWQHITLTYQLVAMTLARALKRALLVAAAVAALAVAGGGVVWCLGYWDVACESLTAFRCFTLTGVGTIFESIDAIWRPIREHHVFQVVYAQSVIIGLALASIVGKIYESTFEHLANFLASIFRQLIG